MRKKRTCWTGWGPINNGHVSHQLTSGWAWYMCYWSERHHHQDANRGHYHRNMERLHSLCLWQNSGAHPWVETISLGYHRTQWSLVYRTQWDMNREGTQDLVRWRWEETPTSFVQKEIASSIMSCTPISSRLVSIHISARSHNVTIIQVYAPASDYDDREIEEFYE